MVHTPCLPGRSSSGASSRPRAACTSSSRSGSPGSTAARATSRERSEGTLRRLGIPCERLTPRRGAAALPVARRRRPALGALRARRRRALRAPRDPRARARPAHRAGPPDTGAAARKPTSSSGPAAHGSRRSSPNSSSSGSRAATSSFSAPDAGWSGTPGFCDYDARLLRPRRARRLGMKVAPDARRPGGRPRPARARSSPTRRGGARPRLHRAPLSLHSPGAPLVGARVCQYDLTADTHFLSHAATPSARTGGSSAEAPGTASSTGRALAEVVADCIEGRRAPESFLCSGRVAPTRGFGSTATHPRAQTTQRR